MVRGQSRRMPEANIDTEKSLQKSCKELPRIGDPLRPARHPAGTKCSFGVRSWTKMGNRKDGFYGEVRLVGVPGWTGDNKIWIPKCSTETERARGIDAALFFSGEEPHYYNYPDGHFDPSELEIAEETETSQSFLGRMVKKYSKKDGVLITRTPISISPPIYGPASASYTAEASATAEESEDNADPHSNPTIAESSQSLQASQPPIASAQKTADKYIPNNVNDDDFRQYLRCNEDLLLSRDGVPGFSMVPNPIAMPGAQNHSPDLIPWYDCIDIIFD